jgi:hypothetical protein
MKRLAAFALIVAIGGCSSSQRASETASASASPSPTPLPLGSCETRVMVIDGVEVVVTSNIDQTLASVEIVKAPDRTAAARAVDDAIHEFGPVRRDSHVEVRQSKWGLSTITDPCGRPVPGQSGK